MDWCTFLVDLARDAVGIGVGAWAGFRLGIRQSEITDNRKTAEDVRTALGVIEDELEEIGQWLDDVLHKFVPEHIVYGIFVPINTFTEHVTLLMGNCPAADVRKIRDAYVLFEKYDREMTTALRSSDVFSDIYKISLTEYWKAVQSPKALNTLQEARQALARLKEGSKTAELKQVFTSG